MKNNYYEILTPLLGLGLLLIISNKGYSQTNVTGGIYSNTTWTAANSPYIVSDTVAVFAGITLTIQPGVTVEFNNNAGLDIKGNLYALGTAADSIIFTSSSPTPYAGIYLGINDGSSDTFGYCRFSYATTGISGGEFLGPLSNCVFNSDLTAISDLNTTINNCTFKYDTSAIFDASGDLHGQPITSCQFIDNGSCLPMLATNGVLNCFFSGNDKGIQGSAIGSIVNCTFVYNKTPLEANQDSIINCTITYNNIGIIGVDDIISSTTISNNTIGMQTYGGDIASCNSICNNTEYNIQMTGNGIQNETLVDNYWCLTDSASIQATIYDGHQDINLGLVYFMPFDTAACVNTGTVLHVWPGDANEDLVVNNYDLIPIGLYYGDTGPARSTVTNTWAAQTATNWDSLQADGYNRSFVDCNGDGTINSGDTLAVSLNYGLTHVLDAPRSSPERSAGTVPLSIVTDSSSYHAGSIVHATVSLGNSTNPVTNIYGLAYDISFNTYLVKPGSTSFNYNNASFLGTKNTNALVMTKLNNDVETVVAGIDHTNKSGYGEIGDLYFTVSNDVSSSQLGLSILSYEAVDAQGNELGLSVTTGVSQLSVNSEQLSIYPNPTGGEINIVSSKNIDNLKVTDILGQLVYEAQPNQVQLKLELKDAGMYFVTVTSGNRVSTSKVMVSK